MKKASDCYKNSCTKLRKQSNPERPKGKSVKVMGLDGTLNMGEEKKTILRSTKTVSKGKW